MVSVKTTYLCLVLICSLGYQRSRVWLSRPVDELMLICQCNSYLQPSTDSQQCVDWTAPAQAYPILEEAPSFMSQQRQSAGACLHDFLRSTDSSRKAAASVYGHMSTFHCSKSTTTENDNLESLGQGSCTSAPTGVAAFNVDGRTLHSLLGLPTKGDFKDLEGEHLH